MPFVPQAHMINSHIADIAELNGACSSVAYVIPPIHEPVTVEVLGPDMVDVRDARIARVAAVPGENTA